MSTLVLNYQARLEILKMILASPHRLEGTVNEQYDKVVKILTEGLSEEVC